MSGLQLSESVLVACSAADLFGYVADFRRAHEWRAEVRASEMHPTGAMRLGSRLREVSVIAGRRVVTESEVDVFDEGHRIGFRHRSGPVPMHGAYVVVPAVAGAELRYELSVDLVGGWSVLAPAFRISWPQRMLASLDELRYRLESTRTSPVSLAS